jgi:hypothetical protein
MVIGLDLYRYVRAAMDEPIRTDCSNSSWDESRLGPKMQEANQGLKRGSDAEVSGTAGGSQGESEPFW